VKHDLKLAERIWVSNWPLMT